MATTTMQDYWSDVENALEYAYLIAFDGCHKIYIALDEIEAQWFRDRDDFTKVTGTPSELREQLVKWYDESCPLKFISSVVHNEENPNEGYTNLIPQSAEDEDEFDDEDESDDYEGAK